MCPPADAEDLPALTKGGKLIEGIFKGRDDQRPRCCVEDYLVALKWAQSMGGLKALVAPANANSGAVAISSPAGLDRQSGRGSATAARPPAFA